MKTSNLFNILLAVFLVIFSVKSVKGEGTINHTDADESSAAMENILTRTSVRDYQDKTVEDSKIEQLLKAAMAAPTIAISQPDVKTDGWHEISPSDYRGNPFNLFSNALSLSVGNKDKMNAMTIGWGGLGVLWGRDRPVITVYVRKDRFTHQFMEDNEYFVVEGFSDKYDKQLKYLGSASGRDEDKMKGSGLTVKYTGHGTPYFDEGNVMFVCKKIYGAPLWPEGFGSFAKDYYSDKPLHSMYIGEIEKILIKQ